jgi:hypothetical protein
MIGYETVRVRCRYDGVEDILRNILHMGAVNGRQLPAITFSYRVSLLVSLGIRIPRRLCLCWSIMG